MNRPDILLVAPELPASSWLNASVAGITPPLGIAYIAAYLRRAGFAPVILDNCVKLMSPEAFARYAAELDPVAVGFTSSTTNISTARALASAFKKLKPSTPVLLGGHHASALAADCAAMPEIDFAIFGEGEQTCAELLSAIKSGGPVDAVNGIAYKHGSAVRVTHPRAPIADIDSIPFPAYDLLPMESYHPSLSRRLSSGNMGAIITSRGCPYRCAFCANAVFGAALRQRSVENVLEEVRLLVRDYDIRELIIWDDTFTVNTARAIAIAEGIRSIRPGLLWSCYSRVDHASDELYEAFYRCGCRELLFGAESADDAILEGIHKDIRAAQTAHAVELCRRHGLSSFCSLIIGLPGETAATAKKTVEFFIEKDPDYAAFCVLVPLPGSELFRRAVSDGLINPATASWNDYVKLFSSRLPPLSMCGLSREELVETQKNAFRRFFFRPSYIWGRFAKCLSWRTPGKIFRYLRGLATILRHQAHNFAGDMRRR